MSHIASLNLVASPAAAPSTVPAVKHDSIASGVLALDARLPEGGLPKAAITEVYSAKQGLEEFALLMPMIARLTLEGHKVALVSPPREHYGHALDYQDAAHNRLVVVNPESASRSLWATEQVLLDGNFALVVLWPSKLREAELLRLQAAAASGGSSALLYRPLTEAIHPSPASLRMTAMPSEGQLRIKVLKCRRGLPSFFSVPLAASAPTSHEDQVAGWA